MPIFCIKCGQENDVLKKLCVKCGEPLASAVSDNLQPGTILDNRYKIKRLVNSGGMGSIYEALDHRFGNCPCAVKEMFDIASNPEEETYLIKRFKREAEILYELRHPGLPVVKNYFVENKRYYLVMDYIEGKNLKEFIRESRGGVSEKSVIEWSIQILDALAYLHNQSPPIIYRDLKPENIMIRNSDKKAILVDFGIARTINPDSKAVMTVIGTFIFAPEEVLQGKTEVRSDIYSMGATMHCLLTGKIPLNPFSFKPVRSVKPDVNPELEEIVMKALSRKPEDRYNCAKKMKEAIELTGKNYIFDENKEELSSSFLDEKTIINEMETKKELKKTTKKYTKRGLFSGKNILIFLFLFIIATGLMILLLIIIIIALLSGGC